MVTRVAPSLKVGKNRLFGVLRGIVVVTVCDRPSSSRAGPLDRYDLDSVAARIARRTQDSLFCLSLRAVNKNHHESRGFDHFFFVIHQIMRAKMRRAHLGAHLPDANAFLKRNDLRYSLSGKVARSQNP
jgi:hypothetical protein